MTDSVRLQWLEDNQMNLISDDFGHWACVVEGMQNVPKDVPNDIQTTFFIEKSKWRKTIREAIDEAIDYAKADE